MIKIVTATTPSELAAVKQLFLEYAAWLGIDLSFQDFQTEMAGFPGDYAPPHGLLLLAQDDESEQDAALVGCAALHAFSDRIGEMKRLYVRPEHRGRGAGRMLANAVIDSARKLGYRHLRLDSITQLREANRLYQSLGFEPCDPYRYNPLEGAVFMDLDLAPVYVYKVSGTDLDDASFSQRFSETIATSMKQGRRVVIVHGGGKELTGLLKAFQIESRFVDGLRVTDARTRDAALMTLSGLANKRLVAALLARGVDALGISGVDASLIRVNKADESLQYVGKPVSVRSDLICNWLDQGLVPVVSPMSIGMDGEIYNVNADHAAGAIASAIDAAMLTFVTNVAAVLDRNAQPIERLTVSATEALIQDGTISGGMIPKVKTALEALASGVRNVRITNLEGIVAGSGTTFHG